MDASTSTLTPSSQADQVPQADLATLRSLLAEIKSGVAAVRTSAQGWKNSADTSNELTYPSGISLLSLKNHLLLSYLHHLVSLFALKLSSRSLADADPAGAAPADVVQQLVKLRVVLEKVAPLEQKLKYQVEKLVRKADQFDEEGAQAEEDVLNDPLAFRPNPANLVLDRTASDVEDDEDAEERAGVYRPPRVAAMPYTEAPAKRKKAKRTAMPSHLVSDMSLAMSSATPYGESTTGLSVSHDPSLQSGTARHLKRVEQYEMENFTRMRMSKKDAKKRRAEEEEVAFGGLGAGKGGKRRLGGFGAEFDDLLGGDRGGEKRRDGAYEAMRGMKRAKLGGGAGERDVDGRSSAGVTGMGDGAGGGKRTKSKFDKAVKRANTSRR
ncbi:hypothetical protein JCM8097_001336 [Rhodosporidiobolus ruineniae]